MIQNKNSVFHHKLNHYKFIDKYKLHQKIIFFVWEGSLLIIFAETHLFIHSLNTFMVSYCFIPTHHLYHYPWYVFVFLFLNHFILALSRIFIARKLGLCKDWTLGVSTALDANFFIIHVPLHSYLIAKLFLTHCNKQQVKQKVLNKAIYEDGTIFCFWLLIILLP